MAAGGGAVTARGDAMSEIVTWTEAPEPARERREVPSRYRVHLLNRAKPTDRGVVYLRGEEQFLLAWPRVKRVFAGRVGEGRGFGTVVFDLAIEVDGPECVTCRVAAEPGREARRVARAIRLGVGPLARSRTLDEVAEEGETRRGFPDADTFADAALEAIRFG